MVMEGEKWYLATIILGATSTTDDGEGEIIPTGVTRVEQGALLVALSSLVGALTQVPPRHSAVKIGGKPAYRRARAGVAVALEARLVRIHGLALLSLAEVAQPGPEGPRVRLDLLVHCSKGTYIRSLARDLGERLGCGGYLASLRRLASGGISLHGCHTIPQVEEAVRSAGPHGAEGLLAPLDAVLGHLPALVLAPERVQRLRHGMAIITGPSLTTHASGLARAYGFDGRLVALVRPIETQPGVLGWQPTLVFPA
jgi:tRNA pseudouridine55 synthase